MQDIKFNYITPSCIVMSCASCVQSHTNNMSPETLGYVHLRTTHIPSTGSGMCKYDSAQSESPISNYVGFHGTIQIPRGFSISVVWWLPSDMQFVHQIAVHVVVSVNNATTISRIGSQQRHLNGAVRLTSACTRRWTGIFWVENGLRAG